MASIATSQNGHVRILFYDAGKRRQAVQLGQCSPEFAAEMKGRIGRLVNAPILNGISKADAVWIAENREFRAQFEKVGLIERSEDDQGDSPQRERMTLAAFLELFVSREGPTKKPATKIVWLQVVKMLNKSMPKVMLDEVSIGHAKKFKSHLQEWKLSPATIHKRIQFAKQFFAYAVDWKMIDSNPFSKVANPKCRKISNIDVPIDKIEKVLKYLAEQEDTTWAAIVGLSRFGGLRCPSEVLSIQWGDVDFDRKRMYVPEPKVEHHIGRGKRECRLFEDLEPLLVALFNDTHKKLGRPPGRDEYVIDKPGYRAAADRETGWANANLRSQLLKILHRAKVDPWPRLFHSMRASCQTELEEQFPLHVVCRWLGNSVSVAKENYLLTKDSHYDQPMRSRRETKLTRAGGEQGTKSAPQHSRKEHATTSDSQGKKRKTISFPRNPLRQKWRIRDLNP